MGSTQKEKKMEEKLKMGEEILFRKTDLAGDFLIDPHINDVWSLNFIYPPHQHKLVHCCVVHVWIVASRRLFI